MVFAIDFADQPSTRFSDPSNAVPVFQASFNLFETACRPFVNQHRFFISHPAGIVTFVRKQQGAASEGLETTHVAAITSCHVDRAIQNDFRVTDQLVELSSKHRPFGYPGDRRRARVLLEREQADPRSSPQASSGGTYRGDR